MFAPNHKLRKTIIRGKPQSKGHQKAAQIKSAAYRLGWAERLKRVFAIDVDACNQCGGRVKIIATINDPIVIKKILNHIEKTEEPIAPAFHFPEAHAPPTGLNI